MVGVETPRTTIFYLIAGHIVVLYLCAIEIRSIYWYDDRMGYKFVKEQPKQPSPTDTSRIVISKDPPEINQHIKYKMTSMIILKPLLEYIIIGSFLFSATGKNNIQFIAFIPVALYFVWNRQSLYESFYISSYMWILFILQYLSCVCNLSTEFAPQPIEDLIIKKAFGLSEWPWYEILLSSWKYKLDWAYYLTLRPTDTTRHFFILDVFLLIFQALYFQHFSHSFHTLSALMKKDDKDPKKESFDMNVNNTAEYEIKPSGLTKVVYKFLKKVFFLYSHIATLFCLILTASYAKGALSLLYPFVSIILMQYELLSTIGLSKWKVPGYFKYILKPYLFFDLTLQFIYQVPFFVHSSKEDQDLLNAIKLFGLYDLKEDASSFWIKAVTFILVLYQDAIHSSIKHRDNCKLKKEKIEDSVIVVLNRHHWEHKGKVCMTYLYNNMKVHEFRSNRKMLERNREELSMLQRRIKGWNEVLHKKESKQSPGLEAELGLPVDLENSRQKIENIKIKLKDINDYPEEALYHAGILEKLYLWCQKNINHILFMKQSELEQLEKTLKKGTHLLPNPVIDYRLREYRSKRKEKLYLEIDKYNGLRNKLDPANHSIIPELIPGVKKVIEENEEDKTQCQENKKPFSTTQLLMKIIYCLPKLLLSTTQGICFALMIIAHIFNGNILSFIYVLSIFCYALVTKCRPHKLYWKILLSYTNIIIGLKYLCSFIELVVSTSLNESIFEDTLSKVKVV